MRKAFDANVPKFKPRLRTAAAQVPDLPDAGWPAQVPLPAPESGRETPSNARKNDQGTHLSPAPAGERQGEGAARRVKTPSSNFSPNGLGEKGEGAGTAAGAGVRADTVDTRRDRLEKIKRRVAEAARPRGVSTVAPVDPSRAAESVLGLVRDLEVDLARAREREEALRSELEGSRGEATRAGAEARAAVERLSALEAQLEEKRTVLSDLLAEMGALEAERDEALRRSQALSALDEERARLLEELAKRADDEARLRGEREAEVEKLSGELRAGAADGARLRAALAQLARERDDMAGELLAARRERDELNAAKRALEQVHTALAQARARLG